MQRIIRLSLLTPNKVDVPKNGTRTLVAPLTHQHEAHDVQHTVVAHMAPSYFPDYIEKSLS